MERVRFVVYRDQMVYDDVTARLHRVVRYEKRIKRYTTLRYNDAVCICNFTKSLCLCKGGINAYFVSAYIATLSRSNFYRANVMRLFRPLRTTCDRPFDIEHSLIIRLRLKVPRKQFLDYKWNDKLMQMIAERQEADHAMSWLSTLGGAFSALGEEFEHCATMAGKISVKQFELALRLNNPLLVARCKLYAALSLIQRGHFTTPMHMIRKIYKFAIKENDVRLQNMCQGVWAKLRYNYGQYQRQKRSLLLKTLHVPSEV
ncbi:PREDICTED: uncharacterized protein F58A4.6 [Vollenhovia emeryi]|uniref:uncharacterized protein F58A4.6 n=1 Tax=Vollenhovia emeryi TaxID=411798 RepID=UPI0005F54D23|nr:PREDICTED: uncharacterized protein F58A4.6 [Vollenhovia emeryi]